MGVKMFRMTMLMSLIKGLHTIAHTDYTDIPHEHLVLC